MYHSEVFYRYENEPYPVSYLGSSFDFILVGIVRMRCSLEMSKPVSTKETPYLVNRAVNPQKHEEKENITDSLNRIQKGLHPPGVAIRSVGAALTTKKLW